FCFKKEEPRRGLRGVISDKEGGSNPIRPMVSKLVVLLPTIANKDKWVSWRSGRSDRVCDVGGYPRPCVLFSFLWCGRSLAVPGSNFFEGAEPIPAF
ncbi:MAG TPA: hypothetical protein VGE59_02055, partial [Patescibacteria group bacterium]